MLVSKIFLPLTKDLPSDAKIKSQNAKLGDELHGNDRGAPKNPKVGKKFLITTLITSIIFLVIYYLVSQNYLNLRGYLQ